MNMRLVLWLSLRVGLINPTETESTRSASELRFETRPEHTTAYTQYSPLHELKIGLWTYNVSSDSRAPRMVFLFINEGVGSGLGRVRQDQHRARIAQSLEEELCSRHKMLLTDQSQYVG